MQISKRTKPDRSVYVQLKQMARGKNGKMEVVGTTSLVVAETNMERVKKVMEKALREAK